MASMECSRSLNPSWSFHQWTMGCTRQANLSLVYGYSRSLHIFQSNWPRSTYYHISGKFFRYLSNQTLYNRTTPREALKIGRGGRTGQDTLNPNTHRAQSENATSSTGWTTLPETEPNHRRTPNSRSGRSKRPTIWNRRLLHTLNP